MVGVSGVVCAHPSGLLELPVLRELVRVLLLRADDHAPKHSHRHKHLGAMYLVGSI